MLLRKWPQCYGWSTSPTLKSTFVAAKPVLLKERANRYLDEDGKGRWMGSREKKERGGRGKKIPFSSGSPRSSVCIDEWPGWIKKALLTISSWGLHEFHSKARCNFPIQHRKIIANSTGSNAIVKRLQCIADSLTQNLY